MKRRCGLLLVAAMVLGCYRSHERVGAGEPDGSERDASVARCEAPFASWERMEAEYPGRFGWVGRHGYADRSYLAVTPSRSTGILPWRLWILDGAAPPRIERDVEVEGTTGEVGGPIAIDARGMLSIGEGPAVPTLRINDLAGRLVSSTPLDYESGSSSGWIVIRGDRIGVARAITPSIPSATELMVLDAADGRLISSARIDRAERTRIAPGGALFTWLARRPDREGGVVLGELSEDGSTPGRELDVTMTSFADQDETSFAFIDAGREVIVVDANGSIDRRGRIPGTPEPFSSAHASVADGPYGHVVAIGDEGGIYLSLPGSPEWLAFERPPGQLGVLADQSAERIGAFIVSGFRSTDDSWAPVRWIGIGCPR